MGVDLTPDKRLARRVVRKYDLRPPIDIQSLVNRYARLTIMHIPFRGVDGISLNLKTPGKATHVIVNRAGSQFRQRFTMAHELGHILIPWHVGAVVIDHADPSRSRPPSHWTMDDWTMESEANSFAAELLMPHSWIEKTVSSTTDLAEAHKRISLECQTSTLSAAIRLTQFLPENVVYAAEKDGIVEYSGRTDGTIASSLERHVEFPNDAFSYSEQHYESRIRGQTLHWWRLPREIRIVTTDVRSWRDILDSILHDIFDNDQAVIHKKRSINGVIGYANSTCKDKRNVDSIVSACVQRLRDRPNYHAVVEHDSFSAFIRKRAEDLASRGPQ